MADPAEADPPEGMLGAFWARRTRGDYDALVPRLKAMEKSFLGNVSYPRDFAMYKQAWGDGVGFKATGGRDQDVCLTVFGEISARSTHGAGGDHKFTRNDGTVRTAFPRSTP